MSALADLLRGNYGLRRLKINDHSSPKYAQAEDLELLADAMQNNYELEDLRIDFMETMAEVCAWKHLNRHLRLNRAGRRILTSYQYQRAKPSRELCTNSSSKERRCAPTSTSYQCNYHHDAFSLGAGATYAQDGTKLNQTDHHDWFDVLDRAGYDLDSVFWIVRETAPYFDHFRR